MPPSLPPRPTLPRFTFHARSLAGRREENDDRVLSRPEIGLFAVADGLGGARGGALASELGLEALALHFSRVAEETHGASANTLATRLRESVRRASDAIHARRRGPLHAMASTLAVLAFGPSHVAIGNVGDSRVYRLRERSFEMLSEDHSVGALLVARGVDPALCARYGHLVTCALGSAGHTLDVHVRLEPHRPGDRYLVCSDGVAEHLPEEALRGVLALAGAGRAAAQLVERALERGSDDNVTALVVTLAEPIAARAGSSRAASPAPSRGRSVAAPAP